MLALFFAVAFAGDPAAAANAKIPTTYKDDLKFVGVTLLEEKVKAVVPSTWVAQSTPKGSYEPPEAYFLGRESEFRIGVLCGPSCKPVEDWTEVLDEAFFKEMNSWSWKKLREEKSLTQRFLTAKAPNGVVQVVRVISAPGGDRAFYCKARLFPQGGGVTSIDPAIEKVLPAFEEACLGMKK